jgi:hypothetical protein
MTSTDALPDGADAFARIVDAVGRLAAAREAHAANVLERSADAAERIAAAVEAKVAETDSPPPKRVTVAEMAGAFRGPPAAEFLAAQRQIRTGDGRVILSYAEWQETVTRAVDAEARAAWLEGRVADLEATLRAVQGPDEPPPPPPRTLDVDGSGRLVWPRNHAEEVRP